MRGYTNSHATTRSEHKGSIGSAVPNVPHCVLHCSSVVFKATRWGTKDNITKPLSLNLICRLDRESFVVTNLLQDGFVSTSCLCHSGNCNYKKMSVRREYGFAYPQRCSKSTRRYVLVREENAGESKSCLQRLVPRTPHPITATSFRLFMDANASDDDGQNTKNEQKNTTGSRQQRSNPNILPGWRLYPARVLLGTPLSWWQQWQQLQHEQSLCAVSGGCGIVGNSTSTTDWYVSMSHESRVTRVYYIMLPTCLVPYLSLFKEVDKVLSD